MLYRNQSPKLQVLNLRSGATLYADAHKSYELAPGDEFSAEVKNLIKQGKAVLLHSMNKPDSAPEPAPDPELGPELSLFEDHEAH